MESLKLGGIFTVTCRDPKGNIKWIDTIKNVVVNSGLAHILNVVFAGTTPVNPWYVGLLNTAPTVLPAHVITNLSEFTTYTPSGRKAYVETIDVTTPATPKMSNTGSKASFTINGDNQTVGGAFLFSASSGTTGTLICGGAFSGGDKDDLDTNDTLEVQYEFQVASS